MRICRRRGALRRFYFIAFKISRHNHFITRAWCMRLKIPICFFFFFFMENGKMKSVLMVYVPYIEHQNIKRKNILSWRPPPTDLWFELMNEYIYFIVVDININLRAAASWSAEVIDFANVICLNSSLAAVSSFKLESHRRRKSVYGENTRQENV